METLYIFFSGLYDCVFKHGLGDGSSDIISHLTGEGCVRECIARKRDDPTINGVGIWENGKPGN